MTTALLERPAAPYTGSKAKRVTRDLPELVTAVEVLPADKPAKTGRKTRELPEYHGKTRPVQDSDWRVYVRDHTEIGLTMTEWALATLYGTFGNWGQKAYPSDRWISRRFGGKPETYGRAREALLSKGLIEVIGTVAHQPSQKIYRLCLPVDAETDHPSVVGDPNKGSPVQPKTDHPDPNKGSQDIHRTREDLHHDGVTTRRVENPDDREPGESLGSLPGSLDIVSASRRAASRALDRVQGSAAKRKAQLPGWKVANDDKRHIAGLLGVSLDSIDAPFWGWFDGLGMIPELSESVEAIESAAYAAKVKSTTSPVGYFKRILPGYLARARQTGEGI